MSDDDREEGWTFAGAARNLAQHVGPGMWAVTRQKLQYLAQCEDPVARRIARDALKQQAYWDGNTDEDDD